MKKELLRAYDLRMEQLQYGSLRGIDFILCRGECLNLSGYESGGRRLLIRLLAGREIPPPNSLLLQEQAFRGTTQADWEQAGVYCLSNQPPFLQCMDLAENFFLLRRGGRRRFALNGRAIHLQTAHLLAQFGLDYPADAAVNRLSRLDRLLVSIVRAVDQGCRLLVLEDVSTGLSLHQIDRLLCLLKKVKQQGVALLISDNWPAWFYPVTDCLTILQDGKIIKKLWNQADFSLSDRLLCSPELPEEAASGSAPGKQAVQLRLTMSGITIHLDAFGGQVLLVHSEDAEVLSRCWQMIRGGESGFEVYVQGRPVRGRSPAALARQRIALWDGGSGETPLFSNLSVGENILLPSLRRISRGGFYQKSGQRILHDHTFWANRLDGLALEQRPMGAACRVMLARCRLLHPRALILYNVISAADQSDRALLQHELCALCHRDTAVILLETADAFCRGFADDVVTL